MLNIIIKVCRYKAFDIRANTSTFHLTPLRLRAADALSWGLWQDSVVYTRSGDTCRREDVTLCAFAELKSANSVACSDVRMQYQVNSVTDVDLFNCTYKLYQKLIGFRSRQRGTQCQQISSCLELRCTQREVEGKAIAKVISCCLRVSIYTRGLVLAPWLRALRLTTSYQRDSAFFTMREH